jgi:uncharacterized OB-fold protein
LAELGKKVEAVVAAEAEKFEEEGKVDPSEVKLGMQVHFVHLRTG